MDWAFVVVCVAAVAGWATALILGLFHLGVMANLPDGQPETTDCERIEIGFRPMSPERMEQSNPRN